MSLQSPYYQWTYACNDKELSNFLDTYTPEEYSTPFAAVKSLTSLIFTCWGRDGKRVQFFPNYVVVITTREDAVIAKLTLKRIDV